MSVYLSVDGLSIKVAKLKNSIFSNTFILLLQLVPLSQKRNRDVDLHGTFRNKKIF